MESKICEELLRSRITDLRIKKDVSEHKMSLDLGKSGSYIRSITSGRSLPSAVELFNIIEYFDMTPAEFFEPFTDKKINSQAIIKTIQEADSEYIAKLGTLVNILK